MRIRSAKGGASGPAAGRAQHGRARSPGRRGPSKPIEDYGLVGDTHTGALVAKDGSIDWLCLPRFDSGACFAALLGDERHGRWRIAPAGPGRRVARAYRPGSLILETETTTDEGTVRVVDFMPPREERPHVVRIVEGVRGRVTVDLELALRYDYGAVVPWIRRVEGGVWAGAGPDALVLRGPVPLDADRTAVRGRFTVGPGDRLPFTVTWQPSYEPCCTSVDALEALAAAERWWEEWSRRCTYRGPYHDAVHTSLAVLKALTFQPTGGIVAALTTSLPEQLGGERNWDYRFCWLRDATFTLYSLLQSGYDEEALAWRDWLLRAVAGDVAQLQVMYGPAGERRLEETELPWLPGYEASRPVRTGNGAVDQFQLDVYGEVLDCLHQARRHTNSSNPEVWELQREILDFLEGHWHEPDHGIWEIRGEPRHFTHSKVMTWVALDRAVKGAERLGLEGPIDRWRALRAAVHDEVCAKGWNAERGAFTQSYGSDALDASLLLIPLVGFLRADDPRVRATVAAIERDLVEGGFVRRYHTRRDLDGLPEGEGVFLACTFWLADNLVLQGREAEARALFERLLGLTNDLGLLSEEYDPGARRLVGNFPQAFSHVSLVNTARGLSEHESAAEHRART